MEVLSPSEQGLLTSTAMSSKLSTEEVNKITNFVTSKLSHVATNYDPQLKVFEKEISTLQTRMELCGLAVKCLLEKLTKILSKVGKDSQLLPSISKLTLSVSLLVANLTVPSTNIANIITTNTGEPKSVVDIGRAVIRKQFNPLTFTSQQFDESKAKTEDFTKSGDKILPKNLIMQASHHIMHRGQQFLIRFSFYRLQDSSVVLMVCFPEIQQELLDFGGYDDNNLYFGDFQIALRFLDQEGACVLSKEVTVEAWHGTCLHAPTATDLEHLNCDAATYYDDTFILFHDNCNEWQKFDSCISSIENPFRPKGLIYYVVKTEVNVEHLFVEKADFQPRLEVTPESAVELQVSDRSNSTSPLSLGNEEIFEFAKKLSPKGFQAFQTWINKTKAYSTPNGDLANDSFNGVDMNDIWEEDESVNVELLHFGHKFNIPKLIEGVVGNLTKGTMVTGSQLKKTVALEILAAAAMYEMTTVTEHMIRSVAQRILDE